MTSVIKVNTGVEFLEPVNGEIKELSLQISDDEFCTEN